MNKTINKCYSEAVPLVTIITPVFNRKTLLVRAMNSVKKQTFKSFEYIIIDDGSTEDLDNVVIPFMDGADFPVMYIKKENGGVHTARNAGIKESRGKYIALLDSDDEYFPYTLQRLAEKWEEIPEDKQKEYRDVVCRCVDQNGSPITPPFPEGINDLPWKEARKVAAGIRGELFGMLNGQLMRDNPWPEPEGVTFVTESILWEKLIPHYRSLFFNDTLRIYHIETEVSYSMRRKKTMQQIKNSRWQCMYTLNNPSIYIKGTKQYLKNILQFAVFNRIWNMKKQPKDGYKLRSLKDRLLTCLLYLPACFIASLYIRKKMNQ